MAQYLTDISRQGGEYEGIYGRMTCHFLSPTWRAIFVLLYNKLTILMTGNTQKACCVIKEITSLSNSYLVDAIVRDSKFQIKSKR